MNKPIKLVPKKKGITDTDRLNALSLLFRKYNLEREDDDDAVVMYYNPEPDYKKAPWGYFGIETPDFYISDNTIRDICDRLIVEQEKEFLNFGAPEIEK